MSLRKTAENCFQSRIFLLPAFEQPLEELLRQLHSPSFSFERASISAGERRYSCRRPYKEPGRNAGHPELKEFAEPCNGFVLRTFCFFNHYW